MAGLDVAMRARFYRLLMDDYEKTGRTFLISTHIIEEAAGIFEEILLLHQGTLLEKRNTDEYLAEFCFITGLEEQVCHTASGLEVVHREALARRAVWCVRDPEGRLPSQAEGFGVELEGAPLNKVFVYVTGGEKEENLA